MEIWETLLEIWEVLFWAVLSVVLIITEIATVQLVAVWFAGGGIAAFIVSLFPTPFWIQLIVFVAVSLFLLLATRPVVRRLISDRKKVATNADSMIGQKAVVKEKIDNREDTGRVLAGGLLWTARTADGSTMEPGETCTVDSIVGVKLIVRRMPEA